jgi:negative regulator of sigma E activity
MVVDGKGIADYAFEVAGRERLKVPAGEFEALRLAQKTERSGDRSREVWLDPARSYLPMRVLIVQKDGTRIDQVATRITLP